MYILSNGGSRIFQRGANSEGKGNNQLFSQIFPKNCMKAKDIGPGASVCVSLVSLDIRQCLGRVRVYLNRPAANAKANFVFCFLPLYKI